MAASSEANARAYQRTKQSLTLLNLFITPLLLLGVLFFPISHFFVELAESVHANSYAQLSLYFLLFSVLMSALEFPLSVFSGFYLEHRYELSNQSFGAWFTTYLKKATLSFFFMAALLCGLYACIWKFEDKWWLVAWAGYTGVSYILGKLFPVLVVPLFYKYSEVEDGQLKERIVKLATRYGMPVKNIYSLNLSKTTKKANAAFMGIGKTKRVVLSDTLLSNFTGNEIETVVAHELGHFKHRDIWKNMGFGLVSSFILFAVAAQLMDPLAERVGFDGVQAIGALPVLMLLFFLMSVILMPLQNAFSRRMERAADRFSLKAYPQPEVFISCMEKLAKVNLADPKPNALYEWFFYNHPAISKRIKMAREMMAS